MDGKWTHTQVAARMEEAATTLKRLPSKTKQGYYSFWPDIVPDANGGDACDKALIRLGSPSAEAITRMDECFDWLRWLEPDQAKLIWLRAERVPWKMITRFFGIARSTASVKRDAAIMQIVAILNLPKSQNVQTSFIQTRRTKLATL